MTVPAVEVCHLVKRYGGSERAAVAGISFQIPPGAVVGLLGPNGSGKTTTTKLICGATRPTSGQVMVFGADPRSQGGRPKLGIGVMHQTSPFDMMLSGLDNLKIAAAAGGLRWRNVRQRAGALLDLLGIAGKTSQLVFTLSGGEMRRLQIVRAMLRQPRLLLLDEPSAGLDVAGRRHLWALVDEMRQQGDSTVLWTSHYVEELERNCDRILILREGKIAGFASPESLVGQFGVPTAVIRTALPDELGGIIAAAQYLGLTAVRVRDHVEVTDPGIREQLPGLLAHPQARDARITAVEIRNPSLEDAFLDIVKATR
jgi:ABC-2 type transport system ATP-binding protein